MTGWLTKCGKVSLSAWLGLRDIAYEKQTRRQWNAERTQGEYICKHRCRNKGVREAINPMLYHVKRHPREPGRDSPVIPLQIVSCYGPRKGMPSES